MGNKGQLFLVPVDNRRRKDPIYKMQNGRCTPKFPLMPSPPVRYALPMHAKRTLGLIPTSK